MRPLRLLLFAVVMLTLPVHADEARNLEEKLRSIYEGKLFTVQSLPEHVQLKGWDELREVDPQAPVFLSVEDLDLKETKIEIKARRAHFYQTAEGEIRGLRGERKKFRLEWREDETVSPLQLLVQVLSPVMKEPKDWSDYWPLEAPANREKLAEKPAEEIAPEVYTVGSDVTPPVCESCPHPAYPDPAKKARAEGTVVLHTVLSKKGRVGAIRIAESTGNELLDQSAVMAVSDWRFKPARRNGKPIPVSSSISIAFTLR